MDKWILPAADIDDKQRNTDSQEAETRILIKFNDCDGSSDGGAHDRDQTGDLNPVTRRQRQIQLTPRLRFRLHLVRCLADFANQRRWIAGTLFFLIDHEK